MKQRLYKFRPLNSNEDLVRAKSIIDTGCFRCSSFYELNDPMEGTFSADYQELIDDIYREKKAYKICSFTGKKGFTNPLMWGYYANGFKGVVIEIEVNELEVHKIEYVKEIPIFERNPTDDEVRQILTSKFRNWKHEDEFRYLKKSDNNLIKIGKIKAVYLGNPYGSSANRDAIYHNNNLCEYAALRDEMKIITKARNIDCYDVTIRSGKILSNLSFDSQIIHE